MKGNIQCGLRILAFGGLLLGCLAGPLSAQTPQINTGGVLNAASYALDSKMAPGVIFALFGTSLTNGSIEEAESTPLPRRLAGARVLANGVAVPLFYASPLQINGQFPVEFAGLASAQIQVEVTSEAGTLISPGLTVSVAAASPGIFTLDKNGRGSGAIRRNANSSLICPAGRADCAMNRALRGEAVQIFLTGLGQIAGSWSSGEIATRAFSTVATPVVTIGGINAEVVYSGLAPGFVGLYQVNAFIPRVAPLGDSVPLRLTMQEVAHEVSIAIGSTEGPGDALPAVPIDSIALVPGNPPSILVGTSGAGILRSADGGRTWTVALLISNRVQLIMVDPTNPLIAYAATNAGFFKSSDGGQRWALAADVNLTFALAIDASAPSTLYAGTNNGLFKSTTGAQSWTEISAGLTERFIASLALDLATPSTLYSGALASDLTGGGVFRTIDGGTTWVRASSGLPTARVEALAINPASPATVYAGTGAGVFKSINGGASWAAANTGLPGMAVRGLVIDPASPSTLYAIGSVRGVYKTTNGADSWTEVNNGLTTLTVLSLTIDRTNPSTVYAGMNNGSIFRSTNSAGSWQLLGAE